MRIYDTDGNLLVSYILHASEHEAGEADEISLGAMGGEITDAQHGIRTQANAHAHGHLSGIGANDHHAQAHTLASHSTKAHSELTGIGASDHHVKTTSFADITDRAGATKLNWGLNKLLKGAGAGADPTEIDIPTGGYTEGARVYHNANQSIPNGTDAALAFNSEVYDTDDIHDPVTNNSRLTCKTPGKYIAVFNGWFAPNTTGLRRFYIKKNGSAKVSVSLAGLDSAGMFGVPTVMIDNLALNDYLEVVVFQNSGVALNIEKVDTRTPFFMMQRVG